MADPVTVIRGDLTLADRVGAKIAERAALDIDGVRKTGGAGGSVITALNPLPGGYPSAAVDMSQPVPVVRLKIAVGWPCAVAQVCATTRDHVADEMARLTGIRPARVEVRVADLVSGAHARRRTIGARVPTAAPPETPGGDVPVPASRPAAVIPGVVIGLLLATLTLVAVRDLIVQSGWLSGSRWLSGTGWLRAGADWLARSTWQQWMWAAALAMTAVGIFLLWSALAPRAPTHVRLAGDEACWTRRGDIARRASTVARAVAGVADATTVVGRRRAKVTVMPAAEDMDVSAIHAEVQRVVDELDTPVRVTVTSDVRPNRGEQR
ncbi:MAG: DUF6286 domain-containing protein [Gordonia sp. (in: high G+C Gram-positive bacteria)]